MQLTPTRQFDDRLGDGGYLENSEDKASDEAYLMEDNKLSITKKNWMYLTHSCVSNSMYQIRCLFVLVILLFIALLVSIVVLTTQLRKIQLEQEDTNKERIVHESYMLNQLGELFREINGTQTITRGEKLVKNKIGSTTQSITVNDIDSVGNKTGCSPAFIVDCTMYSPADVSVGATKDIDCPNSPDGFQMVGNRRYVCKANGNWTLVQNTCKPFCQGSGYHVVPNYPVRIKICFLTVTWQKANESCAADNATLLVLPQNDRAFLNATLPLIKKLVSGRSTYGSCNSNSDVIWVGANDLQQEGSFEWVGGESFSTWHNSLAVLDNLSCDGNHRHTDCIIIDTNSKILHDRNCGASQISICMKS